MAFATVDDLAARFPRALTGAEEEAAEVMLEDASFLLEDASFLLSTRVPGLQVAVDGGDETITTAAKLATVAMVRRCLLAQAAQLNTDPAVEGLSETWGPYGRSVRYRSGDGNMYPYDSELEYLLALVRGDMSTAVSIRSPGL